MKKFPAFLNFIHTSHSSSSPHLLKLKPYRCHRRLSATPEDVSEAKVIPIAAAVCLQHWRQSTTFPTASHSHFTLSLSPNLTLLLHLLRTSPNLKPYPPPSSVCTTGPAVFICFLLNSILPSSRDPTGNHCFFLCIFSCPILFMFNFCSPFLLI